MDECIVNTTAQPTVYDLYRYGGQITGKTYCGETDIQQYGRTLKFGDTAAATELHKKAFRDTVLKITPYVKFTHHMSDCGSIVTKKKKILSPKQIRSG